MTNRDSKDDFIVKFHNVESNQNYTSQIKQVLGSMQAPTERLVSELAAIPEEGQILFLGGELDRLLMQLNFQKYAMNKKDMEVKYTLTPEDAAIVGYSGLLAKGLV